MEEQPLVMHVIPGLGAGGAEHMLASLVTAKRQQPFRQTVVNLLSGGVLAEPIDAAGIPVRNIGMTGAVSIPLAVRRLAGLIRDLRPTAIQSWLYYGDLISYWALKWSGTRPSTRLYWGVRCSDMDQSQYGIALRVTIKACASRSEQPDAVVANSYAGRDVHYRLGYHPRAFPVIPNGVDTLRFRPDAAARDKIRSELGFADNDRVLIHAARVDPMKDHASLLAVAAALPQVKVISVGLGTQNLMAPPNVRTLGLRHDMPSLYSAADLALSTSAFGEGFPNIIAEAMACGLPVVATDVGDSKAIVGESGTIVLPHDSVAMVNAIAVLLAEPLQGRRQRSRACRAWIESQFSLSKAVAAFDALHLRAALPNT
jgi:glycosyltransferase involved in cell wall biosynthesis